MVLSPSPGSGVTLPPHTSWGSRGNSFGFLTSQCLSFLIYQMWIVIRNVRNAGDDTCEVLRSVLGT